MNAVAVLERARAAAGAGFRNVCFVRLVWPARLRATARAASRGGVHRTYAWERRSEPTMDVEDNGEGPAAPQLHRQPVPLVAHAVGHAI
jgi:hypothetical protein